MLNENEASQAMGATAYGSEGDKIGKVGQVFLDDRTGAPQFLTVNTGLFGTNESFVPAQGATLEGDRVTLSYTKDVIKDAPNVDIDSGHLDQSDEHRLYEYYDMGYETIDAAGETDALARDTRDELGQVTYADTDTDVSASGDMSTTPTGHDTSGPTTDDAMTRSEEHLVAGTETREAGRARLRKYVTTEQESVTVPVRKERAVLETEPITGANIGAAGDGPAISEEEHEVVLHEERAVADVVAEPVERVRLGTETVTEEETITGEVRKENIELDGDIDGVATNR